MVMTQINTQIDDEILGEFRDVIYKKRGLKKGDFKMSLQEAIIDYVLKYSKSKTAREFAKNAKERLN